MKQGTCPKCKSNQVYFAPKRRSNGACVMNVAAFSHAYFEHYVCVDCGYTEAYVVAGDREKIRERWELVKS